MPKNILKNLNYKTGIALAVVILIAVVLLVWGFGANRVSNSGNMSCVKGESYIVKGDSMYPIFKDGEKVSVLGGYYKNNSVSRGDVVVHEYAPGRDPIIKSVKGIAGDKLALQKVDGKDVWKIIINGNALKNSAGAEYEIPQSGYNLLSLYVHDYKGVIPKDTVLLMGESSGGTFDATRLGLTAVSDLLGKVTTPPAK